MITRDELYRLVWSEPMTRAASRFDVSDSYLARVCTILNVPRPARGYWAKLAVGKAPSQTPLPELLPGDPEHWSRDSEPVPRARPVAPTPRASRKKVMVRRDAIHPLVSGARHHFESGRPVEEGAYVKPYKKLLVDVTASKDGLVAALALANTLFNALEAAGHRVVLGPADRSFGRMQPEEREADGKPRERWHYPGLWSPARPTVVYIGTVTIGLSVIEMSEHVTMRYVGDGRYIRDSEYVRPRGRAVDHSWTTTRDVRTGRFRILAYSPYGQVNWAERWQDTKTVFIANRINVIVGAIEAMAPVLVDKIREADEAAERRRSNGPKRKSGGGARTIASGLRNRSSTAVRSCRRSSVSGLAL